MQLQNIDIFSTGGFIFFLLIILVGYLWVEIIFWKKYIFRDIFDNYKNSLFDRMIHYIVWWFIINITIFTIFSLTSWPEYFALFDESSKVAIALQPIIWEENTLSAQFIIISVTQFLLIFSFWLVIWIGKMIWYIFSEIAKYCTPEKKVKKKKTFFEKLKSKFKRNKK